MPRRPSVTPNWRPIVLVIGLLLLPGCKGDQPSKKLVPVKGTVSVDGSPMQVGTVTFMPDAAKGNKTEGSAAGSIAADGTYKLFYGTQEGAPLGWYKVGVSPQGMSANPSQTAPSPEAAAKMVTSKFQNPETSGISVEVVSSPAAGAYDIKVSK